MEQLKKIKEVKNVSVLIAILAMVYGLVLIIWPETSAQTICYIVAAMLALIGLFFVIQYIRKDVKKDFYRKELVFGLCFIAISMVAFFRVELLIEGIPIVLGFYVLFSGIVKLQNAFDLLRLHYSRWYGILILALINLVFGAMLIVQPMWSVNILFVLIGCGLLFSGITDLFTIMFVASRIRKMKD